MRRLRDLIRQAVPHRWIEYYRRRRYGQSWFDPRGRGVKQVFAQIYQDNVWGGTPGEFYSGPGSDSAVTQTYVDALTVFLREQKYSTIVDIGCGDFRVGSQLITDGINYVGVDVVPALIAHHQEKFAKPGVSFLCLDAISEVLPTGDVCLIRQVLQHLSNAQISAVLKNCSGFKALVITEHVLPDTDGLKANRDIHHGNETRIEFGSYVALDHEPFHANVERVLCETPLADGSIIRTFVVRPSAD